MNQIFELAFHQVLLTWMRSNKVKIPFGKKPGNTGLSRTWKVIPQVRYHIEKKSWYALTLPVCIFISDIEEQTRQVIKDTGLAFYDNFFAVR